MILPAAHSLNRPEPPRFPILSPLSPAGELPKISLEVPDNADSPKSFWGSAEYVSWWVLGSKLPPLVTASPVGTPLASAGVLGAAGTTTLFGDERVNGQMRPGGRFTIGYWLNDEKTCGIEAGVMLIGGRQASFSASSDGSQILARPFVDATVDAEISQLLSFPGIAAGNINVASYADPLIVADFGWRHNLCVSCGRRIDFLVGYRYVHFAESLQIDEELTSLDPATLDTHFRLSDSFSTRNDFHGAFLGIQTEQAYGPFSLQLLGKLAFGNMHREVTISGNTAITPPGVAPIVTPGGLLALAGNSGTFRSNQFVWLPEFGITGGWQVSPSVRVTLGYSFLWLSDVVRPGDQIDRTVNPNLLAPAIPSTPNRPTFSFRESDLWIHGLRVGAEIRF